MTLNPAGDGFDSSLAVFAHDIRSVLPEDDCHRLVDRIRAVHGDWPDLGFADAADMARASLRGEREQHARQAAAHERIHASVPHLRRLHLLHPDHASVADALAARGLAWGDVGLTAADGVLLQSMVDESDREGDVPPGREEAPG
ncbi:hypothetical protein [Streptomyces osmaniensis]|uniref:Uncharacterized protein n=1 Tax=Streptomyces osmaniensis TaxID=593134 RepID=A0ABP6YUS8_9ACTN|nr:hypothetical protein KJK32_46580 [Streptomyces sp. JCM17656]